MRFDALGESAHLYDLTLDERRRVDDINRPTPRGTGPLGWAQLNRPGIVRLALGLTDGQRRISWERRHVVEAVERRGYW